MVVAFIGGLGGNELLLALAVALIVFGPRRLPEIARKLSKVSNQLRNANQQIRRELYSNLDPDEILRERGATPPAPPPTPVGRHSESEAPADAGAPDVAADGAPDAAAPVEADYDAPYRDAAAAAESQDQPELPFAGDESEPQKADPDSSGSA